MMSKTPSEQIRMIARVFNLSASALLTLKEQGKQPERITLRELLDRLERKEADPQGKLFL